MKGSTLHRSGLTREKMSVLASSLSVHNETKQNTRAQLNQYYKTAKARELDLLWGNVHKGIQKVHNVTRSASQKSPMTYLVIGFILGALFMGSITLIVSICSSIPNKAAQQKIENKTNVALIEGTTEEGYSQNGQETLNSPRQEKYIIKKGDTLNGIAYRFYGKYNEAKIKEIQRINNIKSPTSLQVGQELLIPVSQQ